EVREQQAVLRREPRELEERHHREHERHRHRAAREHAHRELPEAALERRAAEPEHHGAGERQERYGAHVARGGHCRSRFVASAAIVSKLWEMTTAMARLV